MMTQEDIRKLYSGNEWLSTREIVERTGNSKSSVYQCLERMRRNNSIEREKKVLERSWFYLWKLRE